MSNLNNALDLAEKGYYVFPVFEKGERFKHPRTGPGGFKNATQDPYIITDWWNRHPGSLVGVSLDQSGLTVIDVDAHQGAISGYDVLAACGFSQTSGISGRSVSGLGEHFWYLGQTPSGKAATSVDRKSAGGYVIVTYDLPHVSEIVDDVPDWAMPAHSDYQGGSEPGQGYGGTYDEWVRTLSLDNTDIALEQRVERKTQIPFDYSDLRDALWVTVSAGAEGAAGVPAMIEGIRQRWLSGDFNTDLNKSRFEALLLGAISEKGPFKGPRIREQQFPEVPEYMSMFNESDVMDVVAADYAEHGLTIDSIPSSDDPAIETAARQMYINNRARELVEEWETPQELKFVSLDDLCDLSPVEPLWNDMFFEGTVSVLAADGGVGKTTVMIGLALAMGNDVELLGEKAKQGRVLFFVGEGARNFGKRVKSYESYWGRTLDRSHVTTVPGKVLTKTLMQQVMAEHRRNPYDMIVFDTMAALFNIENENDNAQVGRVMRWLKELRDVGEQKTTVVLVHHTTNGTDAKGRKFTKARGASAIRNDADTVILMTKTGDGLSMMTTDPEHNGKQRDAEPKTIENITLKKNYHGVVTSLATPKDIERAENRIIDLLQKMGTVDQMWTSTELQDMVGSEKIYKAMRTDAIERGYILKESGHRGLYHLTPEGFTHAHF